MTHFHLMLKESEILTRRSIKIASVPHKLIFSYSYFIIITIVSLFFFLVFIWQGLSMPYLNAADSLRQLPFVEHGTRGARAGGARERSVVVRREGAAEHVHHCQWVCRIIWFLFNYLLMFISNGYMYIIHWYGCLSRRTYAHLPILENFHLFLLNILLCCYYSICQSIFFSIYACIALH